MQTFNDLGLSEQLLSAVKRMGYEVPTPVQEQSIPLVLEGRDVLAAAQTGTGKTAAFTLPILDRLPHAKGGQGPLMLVVTPTRELAQQIGDVAKEVAVSTHHRIATVVGGLSYKPQIDRLKHGVDVLIATPGRLIDLMEQKAVRLDDIQVLVLDEADRMLDMGFLPAVKRIVNATPKSRQTLLFSATIDKSIMNVAGDLMHNPATVEIARKGDVASTVEHYVIRVPQSVKPDLLKAVLEEKGFNRVIVFARTRSRADSSCRRLRRAGYKVEAIHSDRSQNQRKRALEHFANGEVNVITATDVLARGIDVDEVDYVINFDVPDQPEDYIHRIGRTGRAGQTGFAITFVTPETEGELKAIEKLIKAKIPEMSLESFDMEEAKARSAQKAMEAKSGRDPEVRKVKRELGNKQSRQGSSKKGARKAAEAAGDAGRQRGSDKGGHAASGGNRKGSRRRSEVAAGRPASSRGGKKASASASPARKGDFRPGRSRRAEVQRSRNRHR